MAVRNKATMFLLTKAVDTGLEAAALVVAVVPKGAAAVELEASLTTIILDV